MNRFLTCVFIVIAFASNAQVNRYVVHFTDKADSPYLISQPEEYLSSRALDRREKNNISITEEDLPVNPHYLDSLREKGAQVFYSSRWFNLALVEMDESLIDVIESISIVSGVSYVAPGSKLGGRKKSTEEKNDQSSHLSHLEFHDIDIMHNLGYDGKGVWVAIMDGGFAGVSQIAYFNEVFSTFRMAMVKNYVEDSQDVFKASSHGTKVFSLIGAYDDAESYIGGAYNSVFGLFMTEDVSSEYRIEEYNWLFAAEAADSAGFDIINTSLGYTTFDDESMNYTYEDMDGVTTVIARASNMASARGILMVTSAGNQGNSSWRYISTPADAIGNVSVGAVDLNGDIVSFSSRGPSADGRIKPEVAAFGSGVPVINENGDLTQSSGTSFSAPIVSAIAAGLMEQYPDFTLEEIRSLIIDFSSQSSDPDNLKGYGVLVYGGGEITNVEGEPESFKFYPNPASNLIHVPGDVNQIEAVDITGRTYGLQSVAKGIYDTSKLKRGIYTLKVRQNNKLFISKLIKE